ncbi:mannose-1-phosphate guanylyltransferase [Paenibacillus nasutitermitis]|uniref:Mannose-1-phosphate guanylyltransferase n=1 Tax=Paenibacillus nasutitermitis TaxID=1652958 RepID=A0A916Z3T6_9BACL|nr:sugar phosphate nucleotidyltransferase [Paenibacillus nasutitermitis]GGD75515.1 mannose-1-phosphate guanylyltransferase [Paenibacillus nasutitermitis]
MNIVIMAGGKGTRFWPRSVDAKPKQFLSFHTERTLIQETLARFRKLVDDSRLFIAVPKRYLPLVETQLPDLNPRQIIVEPEQKDTAACIALAAFRFLQAGDDRPVVFAPSDQYVADEEPFLSAIRVAARTAQIKDAIVTLGVQPSRPETGFGYLRTTASDEAQPSENILRVIRFLEKPDTRQAEQLIEEPDVFWNSGVFICRPSTIQRAMERFQPQLWNSLVQYPSDAAAAYARMPQLSIDYAVMEHIESLYCIPIHCGWDDIGSWAALRRHLPLDANDNLINGAATLVDARGNTVYVGDQQALIIGVHDLIIVSTGTGLLVCPRSEEPRLKSWLNQTPG